MVNAKEFFSGNYLKAELCKGGEVFEIMDEGNMEEIRTPEGKIKVVLNFDVKVIEGSENLTPGKIKTFTPNKSNGDIMVKAWKSNTSNWNGKRFEIDLAKTQVFGKIKDSIVVIPLDVVEVQKIQKMAKRKVVKPMEEWEVEEWKAYARVLESRESDLLSCMRKGLKHLAMSQNAIVESLR